MRAVAQLELTARTVARNPWIVAGLLVLSIGLVDVYVGRSKLAEYRTVQAQSVVVRPRDPTVLFPKVTEAEEQRAVARAKLGFYNLLFLFGQVMTLIGLLLASIGLLQLRRRPSVALTVPQTR
jgi:hypothetical protein